jgi:mRNA-degrading endonuclease toxin of MazEF toxin-antitoxin module
MVVLLSWDAGIGIRDRVTVAPITSRIRGLDAEVVLDEEDGVREPCAINCDILATVLTTTLRDPVTRLSGRKLREIERAIHEALGMELPCTIA